jgi:hypothetical protein
MLRSTSRTATRPVGCDLAPILRISETELAVSREIVEHIWVQPGAIV